MVGFSWALSNGDTRDTAPATFGAQHCCPVSGLGRRLGVFLVLVGSGGADYAEDSPALKNGTIIVISYFPNVLRKIVVNISFGQRFL